MSALEKKSIIQMAMGAIEERVDYEMTRIIDNIIDPNTKATGKRSLTVKIDLTPADDRQTIQVSATALYITNDTNGEMAVVEMVPQIPGQMNLESEEQASPKVLRLVVNR